MRAAVTARRGFGVRRGMLLPALVAAHIACGGSPGADGLDGAETGSDAGSAQTADDGSLSTGDTGSPDAGNATDGTAETGETACPPNVWEGNFVDRDPTDLAGYTEVTGLALIGERQVVDLVGMECLDRTALGLGVSFNPNLTTLDGLDRLVDVGEGALRVTDNPELLEITALSTLERVGSRIAIQDNPKLASLEGLERITSANEILEVTNNDSLVDLRGLDGLTSENYLLAIGDNDTLIGLQGLDSLVSIVDVTIYDNPALTSLDGLDGVETADDVRIASNAVLVDVSALVGAKVGATSTIEIYENPMLPQCAAETLAEALQPPGFTGVVDVRDNLGTCP